jgi:hypothetical protein
MMIRRFYLSTRIKLVYVMVGVFLRALNVSIVSDAPPETVLIVVDEFPGFGTIEPFTASGPAAENGLVCVTGMVEDLAATWNTPQGPFQII